jgi:hypothetical protein
MNGLSAQRSGPSTVQLQWWVWFASALVLAGCGQPAPMAPGGDAAAARKALSHALEAWKEGRDAKSLQSETPVYWVADEDWSEGRKLTDYQIGEEVEQSGGHWRICAQLTLSSSGGSERTEKFCYAVTLAEAISIIRSDFLY